MLQGFCHVCIFCIDSVSESSVKLRLQIIDFVPSHCRHFVFVLLWLESLDVHIEDADAVYVSFFRMSAQELLSHADAQNGLLEILDYLVQLVILEVLHGFPCLTLSWKQHTVCFLEHFGIIGEHRLDAQTLHGVDHGIDIPGIVFYDCYIHNLTYFFCFFCTFWELPPTSFLFSVAKVHIFFQFKENIIKKITISVEFLAESKKYRYNYTCLSAKKG